VISKPNQGFYSFRRKKFGVIRMRRIQSLIRKNQFDFIGIMLVRYPKFIISNQVDYFESIPVFVFHQVYQDDLESKLRYLVENGYQTLNYDELYTNRSADKYSHQKKVVLTFDDGDKSLLTVAYPLLKKYGLTGVAFIIPGLISESDQERGREYRNESFCSWQEIQEMHRSGVIDFQVHSMYHHSVFVSPKIVGYVEPSWGFPFNESDYLPAIEDGSKVRFPDSLKLGTPLYESAFRFRGKVCFHDSIGLRKACADFVSQNGNEDFFKHKRWKKRMDRFVKDVFSNFAHETRYETPTERDNALRRDFREAKKILEEKLEDKKACHFCFPYFSGCSLAIEISAQEGYLTNSWGGILPKFTKFYKNPIHIPRFNSLYIWRLPGRGRKSLGEVLRLKYSVEISRKLKEIRTAIKDFCSV
jgi:hypothetical protein